MQILDIITKKKLGQPLTREEITFFARGAADKTIPDYQLAALLMAIRLNGMTAQETTDLTLAMRDSGDVCDLSAIPGKKIDKHSTGGVGDTTTLILAPLVAACGVPVAKMSGRGLGHTGGTLGKLESIPGLSVEETEERFIRQVQEIGLAVIGQTAALAPADKTLYALRDVTSTVDSLPLIAASIMSKKLASGADGIVLDVKTGSGALMETLPDALALAQTMVDIGKLAGKPVVAVITSMAQPLGTHIGNALEVKDAIDVLAGRTQGDLLEISLLLGSHMLVLAEKAKTLPEARTMLENALSSGAGLRKLAEMIAAQGGDPRVVEDLSLLPQAAVKRVMRAETAGYLSAMDTTALGMAAQRMGAGRAKKSDMLDYTVGYVLHVRLGDEVTEDTPLATLYARNEAEAEEAEKAIRKALTIARKKPQAPKLWINTRKGHESEVHSIARRGQGGTSSLFISPLQGQRTASLVAFGATPQLFLVKPTQRKKSSKVAAAKRPAPKLRASSDAPPSCSIHHLCCVAPDGRDHDAGLATIAAFSRKQGDFTPMTASPARFGVRKVYY